MLTSWQCQIVAYLSNGTIFCPDCVTQTDINEGNAQGIIEYEFEGESWKDGAYCDACMKELSEPWPVEDDPDDLAQFEPED